MNQKFTLIASLFFFLSLNSAFSQEPDSTLQARVKYISKQLSLPDPQTKDVIKILDTYKENANKVFNDMSISEKDRSLKVKKLMETKNLALKKILSANQLVLIVPTSELEEIN